MKAARRAGVVQPILLNTCVSGSRCPVAPDTALSGCKHLPQNVFIQQITCCLIRVGLAATPDGSAHRYLIAAIVLGHVQPLVGVKNQLATV